MALSDVVEALARAVPGCDPQPYQIAGDPSQREGVLVAREHLAAVLELLRRDPAFAFDMLVDLTAVDREPLDGVLDVIYLLRSFRYGRRLMVKVKLPAGDLHLPTASGLWKNADWAEREVYDMFGVVFEGHPDLRRILMYPEFVGHPLRKSYPYQRRQPLVPERDPVNDPWPEH